MDGTIRKVVCKYFREGNCRCGKACLYLHPQTDQAGPAATKPNLDNTGKQICQHFLTGTCTYGSKCRNLHVRREDSTAAQPATGNVDTATGNVVTFVPPSTGHAAAATTSTGSIKKICQHFLTGTCTYGSKCRNLHVRSEDSAAAQPATGNVDTATGNVVMFVPPSTGHAAAATTSTGSIKKICQHFLTGTCTYGSSCRNLHVRREDSATAQSDHVPTSEEKLKCVECGAQFLPAEVKPNRFQGAHPRPELQKIPKRCPDCHTAKRDRDKVSCPSKALCAFSNCRLNHPARAPECKYGSECKEIVCNLLHPGTDLEISLIGPQPPALHKVASMLLICRNNHKRKIADARAQCMRGLGIDTGGRHLKDISDPRVAAFRELQQLLQCFDEALLQVWSKLKGVEHLKREAEVGDEGGLSQLARQNSSDYEVSAKEAHYRMKRETYRLQAALPALARRSELVRAIRDHASVIVRGATGSGKSTQVPAYLAEMVKLRQLEGHKIICTQPRKVAAISLATRVSEEWNCGKKDQVGYAVGYRAGKPKTSKYTVIEYSTEGSLLNMLVGGKRKQGTEMDDKEGEAKGRDRRLLQNVACIVLDEAHERTMTLDVILGVLHAGQKDGRWPHLKIVVTSATLDVELFSRYLDNAPIIEIPGRMFPVNIIYKPLPTAEGYVQVAVALAAEIHMGPPDSGDVLVFLTGEAEVVQAVDSLERTLKLAKPDSRFLALPLFGKQTPDEQALVFAKAPAGTRKIIFSTDIAETSVTIDGVRHVVDTGMTKEAIYDVKRNVTVLEVGMISKSSATQRTGRAGRTAPGTCYRLYSQDTEASMRTSQLAEVLSKPLEQTFVTVVALGLDPLHFNWIEKPNTDALRHAGRELQFLGAVDASGALTSLGQLIAELQVNPALARLVYIGCQRGMGEAAAVLGGLLSTASNIFFRGRDSKVQEDARSKHAALRDKVHGDPVTLYRLYETYQAVLYSTERPGDTKDEEPDSFAGEDIEGIDEDLLEQLKNVQVQGVTHHDATAVAEDNNDDADFDSINDASSVTSDISDASSVDSMGSQESYESAKSLDESLLEAQAEEEAERVAARRVANNRAAKRWCVENYVNGKAIGIATSTARDMKNASGRLNIFVGDQSRKPSNPELQRLFASAYFLNVAVRVGEAGPARGTQYHLLRSDRASRGFFHPSSSLSDAPESPEWVVFAAVTETTRTFLTSVAPAQRAWLAEESPAFAEEVDRRQGTRPVNFSVDVSRGIIRRLVGKNYQNGLRALADCVGASDIYSDEDAGKLSASCLPAQADQVRKKLELEINAVRRTALAEVCEEPISSTVRVCYKAGGEVDCVLFPGQFISLSLSNLPPNITAGDLRSLAAPFGAVRDTGVMFRAAGDSDETAYGRLLFATPAVAAAALAGLNHEMIQGREIVVRPGGAFIPKEAKAAQQCKVIVSWSLAPSTGRCLVIFSTEADCISASRIMGQRGMKVGPFVPKAGKDDGKSKGGGPVRDQTTLSISGLPSSADEEDVMALIISYGCRRPKSVSVQRKLQEASTAVEDTRPISVVIEEIMSLIPLRERILSATSFFTSKNTRVGLTVDYGIDQDISEIQRLWLEQEQRRERGPVDRIKLLHGQRIRLRAEHSMHASVDEGLYTHFKAKLVQLAERGSRDFGVQTRTNIVRGKAMVHWSSPSREWLMMAVREFESVVASTPYNPNTGRHLLFTKAGRTRMEKATADDVYVLWDVRRKLVTIHGEFGARQRAVLALDAAIQEFQKEYVAQHFWMNRPFLKVIRRERNDIVQRFKLLDIKWEGTQLIVTGLPRELALLRLDGRFAGKIRDTPPAQVTRAGGSDCPVCFCPVDAEWYSLLACGHAYCEACIKGQLAGAESQTEVQLPLACVEQSCIAAHAWYDITALASPAALGFIKETAVTRHLLAHGASLRRCVNTGAGCTSLLELSQVRALMTPEEERALGGRVAECGACARRYCLSCSDRDQQPIEAHPGVVCSMAGLADRVDVRTHLHRIESLLNLKCPRCACVFLDFSGCAAVTCSNGACNAAFCALCLRDCGGDAHGHVRDCALNPSKGNYFVSEAQFNKAHTERRAGEVRRYIQDITDPHLRELVVVEARPMLKDIGIQL